MFAFFVPVLADADEFFGVDIERGRLGCGVSFFCPFWPAPGKVRVWNGRDGWVGCGNALN